MIRALMLLGWAVVIALESLIGLLFVPLTAAIRADMREIERAERGRVPDYDVDDPGSDVDDPRYS